MNPVLEEILRIGQIKTINGTTTKIQLVFFPEQGEFLQGIIREIKPLVSLEVGLAYGISALFICDALEKTPATRHIIIDPYQFSGLWKGMGLNNLKEAGYKDIIEFHEQTSQLVLPQLESQGRKVDFAFVDGWHTFDHTLVDFFYIDRLLRVGGVVVLHDAGWPSIRKVCRYIVTNRSYSVFRCFKSRLEPRLSLKRRILQWMSHKSEIIRRLLKPEFIMPDSELGLVPNSPCIAFRKEAPDTRQWDFHQEF
ncbi:MAG: class I SAM-dependent methyltransferase [Planctomycetota bacterium]|nr:class I SAM-dependent methyltransferase [Planctomycetota bacterium]